MRTPMWCVALSVLRIGTAASAETASSSESNVVGLASVDSARIRAMAGFALGDARIAMLVVSTRDLRYGGPPEPVVSES